MTCSYLVVLLMSTMQNFCIQIFREFAQLCCLLQNMDNVQNAVNQLSGTSTLYPEVNNVDNTANPLSGISMHNIQNTADLSRHCIQFAPTRVHHNTRSLHSLDSSSKTSLAFLIANEYFVFVVRCTTPYIQLWKLPESYRTN